MTKKLLYHNILLLYFFLDFFSLSYFKFDDFLYLLQLICWDSRNLNTTCQTFQFDVSISNDEDIKRFGLTCLEYDSSSVCFELKDNYDVYICSPSKNILIADWLYITVKIEQC